MISILMAVRSGWEFIFEAVDSVFDQTYCDWRLLIGVNGLPAGSAVDPDQADLLEYADADDCISVYEWPDCQSKPEALNRLMQHAHGDHIAILDVDDVWLPDKLEKQLPFLDKYDVVGTGAEYFGSESGPIGVKSGEVTFDDLLQCNHIVNSSVVMRRELAVWDETDDLDDYPLWLKLAHEGKTFCNVQETLTRIRCHPNQWFAGKRDNSDELRQAWAAKK